VLIMIGGVMARRIAIAFAALGCFGCAQSGPPSQSVIERARGGEEALVLVRVTFAANDGRRFEAFAHIAASENIGFALGDFETGGVPSKGIDHTLPFLSEASRKDGWTYFRLKPGKHYLAVQGPRRRNYFAYARAFRTAPRWEIEVPAGAAVIYAGTLHLRGTTRSLLIEQDRIGAITGAEVADETQAAALAAQHLSSLGPPRTALMKRHWSGTYQF
jgi:hypothetical protein